MVTFTPHIITAFQQKVLTWYQTNKRDLPWRHTTNPYYIHLSEIMLQQTQVDRVIVYYKKFLEAYPTLQTMVDAPKPQLLLDWQGLGYNNRILRFQESCKAILNNHNGVYPQTEHELIALPGVGPYTARAILAFAFNKEVPVIDTNIRRILIHEFTLPESLSVKELEQIATKLVPHGQSREYHNALMDLGAIELTAKKTGIESLSKQGTFVGSTRWVRSRILKQLLVEKTLPVKHILTQFANYDVNEILYKMERDGLITINDTHIRICE